AQRVSAQALDDGTMLVHAATDVLRDVPRDPEIGARLGALNRFATLSALVHHPDEGRVRYHCAVAIHPETAPSTKPLLLTAMSIQVADAHVKAEVLASLLGGTPDVTEHPHRGPRPEPDDMIDVIEHGHVPLGRERSPFTADDFAALRELEANAWAAVEGQGTEMTCLVSAAPGWPGIARFFASGSSRHPQLGSGALLRVSLPPEMHPDVHKVAASALNTAELARTSAAHCLGAWCTDPRPELGLTYVTFLPAATHRRGLLVEMARSAVIRARWATKFVRRTQKMTTRGAAAASGEAKAGA